MNPQEHIINIAKSIQAHTNNHTNNQKRENDSDFWYGQLERSHEPNIREGRWKWKKRREWRHRPRWCCCPCTIFFILFFLEQLKGCDDAGQTYETRLSCSSSNVDMLIIKYASFNILPLFSLPLISLFLSFHCTSALPITSHTSTVHHILTRSYLWCAHMDAHTVNLKRKRKRIWRPVIT